MILTKFLLYSNIGDPSGVRLALTYLPQVPDPGEVINIDGNPYQVAERSWALDDPNVANGECPDRKLYCYVKVIKAGDFKVTLGGREY